MAIQSTQEFQQEKKTVGLIDCPILVTNRLVLRPPHDHDVDDMMELANNYAIAQMLGRMPHPYGREDAKAYLDSLKNKNGGCDYAITLRDTGRFIGCAGLDTWRKQGLELGYWLGQPYWQQGYASEVGSALTDLAFRASEIDHLRASCRVQNKASRRVLEKSGFTYLTTGKMTSKAAGEVEAELFEISREAWLATLSPLSNAV